MYHPTGFTEDEIVELCVLIHAADSGADRVRWPSILGLFKSVVVALTYLRRNHVQQELAEYYAVTQSTISRAITAVTPRLAQVLRQFTPTAEELPPDVQLIVDGTLVSCWSWDNHNELYSGKHHTTGLNLQVVCDLAGRSWSRWLGSSGWMIPIALTIRAFEVLRGVATSGDRAVALIQHVATDTAQRELP